MGLIRLGREREALHLSGEQYKKAAQEFFQAKGWNLIFDSSIEGTFQDQLYLTDETKMVMVECKDSAIGLYDERFLIPLAEYLSRFLKHSDNAKFLTLIAVRQIRDFKKFKEVFVTKNPAAIKELLDRILQKLVDKGKDDLEDQIKNTTDSEMSAFLDYTYVYEASYEDFTRTAKRMRGSDQETNDLVWVAASLDDTHHRAIAERTHLTKGWKNEDEIEEHMRNLVKEIKLRYEGLGPFKEKLLQISDDLRKTCIVFGSSSAAMPVIERIKEVTEEIWHYLDNEKSNDELTEPEEDYYVRWGGIPGLYLEESAKCPAWIRTYLQDIQHYINVERHRIGYDSQAPPSKTVMKKIREKIELILQRAAVCDTPHKDAKAIVNEIQKIGESLFHPEGQKTRESIAVTIDVFNQIVIAHVAGRGWG